MAVIAIIFIILVVAYVAVNIRIVPQANAWVIERLGKYSQTWDAGLHVKVPFIERVIKIAKTEDNDDIVTMEEDGDNAFEEEHIADADTGSEVESDGISDKPNDEDMNDDMDNNMDENEDEDGIMANAVFVN